MTDRSEGGQKRASYGPPRIRILSTKYWDGETGLYYYGYRYYSSELGRWLSRDPLGERGGYNLYAFTYNNPINFFDLLGNDSDSGDFISTALGGDNEQQAFYSAVDSVNKATYSISVTIYNIAYDCSDTLARLVVFPIVDLLALPDEAIKYLFDVTDDELISITANFPCPAFVDDLAIGVIVAGGRVPKGIRKIFGYSSEKVTLTIRYKDNLNPRDFERKTKALQDLAERGKLAKAPTPVSKDPYLRRKYRNNIEKRIKKKYANNPQKKESLLKKLQTMDVDHQNEAQTMGLDDFSNFWLLDSETNQEIGRQLRKEIKDLDDFTRIDEIIVER